MQIRENQSLKPFCTFKIGGEVRYLINWNEYEELPEILEFIRQKQLPCFFFGGGSNLVFPDGQIEAVFVRCNITEIKLDDGLLCVEAGARWPILARFCATENFQGLEALYGLPGTVGGALYGNAGCHGCEMKDVVNKYEYYDLKLGEYIVRDLTPKDFSYRESTFHNHNEWLITRCWFNQATEPFGDPQEYADFRNNKQPKGLTTGSFFKNPLPQHAGKLLDDAGLKGHNLPGSHVQFSDLHANFMINQGEATAAQVEELATFAQQKVKELANVQLQREVRQIKQVDFIDLQAL